MNNVEADNQFPKRLEVLMRMQMVINVIVSHNPIAELQGHAH